MESQQPRIKAEGIVTLRSALALASIAAETGIPRERP